MEQLASLSRWEIRASGERVKAPISVYLGRRISSESSRFLGSGKDLRSILGGLFRPLPDFDLIALHDHFVHINVDLGVLDPRPI